MSRAPRYDHLLPYMARRRAEGASWAEIAAELSIRERTLRNVWSHARRRGRITDAPGPAGRAVTSSGSSGPGRVAPSPAGPIGVQLDADGQPYIERTFTEEQARRITSLDDLLTFFQVDTERWEVREYRVNSWEQHSVKKGIVTLYQVRANLRPRIDHEANARTLIEEFIRDAAEHAPVYEPPAAHALLSDAEGVLFELAIFDPHIGMLAWGRETGEPYDTSIAVRDYAAAVDYLLGFARLYNTARILYIVGNDLMHVDQYAITGTRSAGHGGATTAGTPQSVDTRLARIFTETRRALIRGIDKARTIAPVDVLCVPGNHDQEQIYRMGETLFAWYRNDDRVNVIYGPETRKFYRYGNNAIMFTHGEEYRRKRDNLPLIFATECPADIWASTTVREIHTGHNHAALQGGYYPTAEADESRGIRTRSLPALTPEDKWHYAQGYRHRRAATVLVWAPEGGVVGQHEFTLN